MPPFCLPMKVFKRRCFSSPDNKVLISFLGTSEFLEREVCSPVGNLQHIPAANLWGSRCALPCGRAPGGAFICRRSCLIPPGRALMKVENIFCCVTYALTDTEILFRNIGEENVLACSVHSFNGKILGFFLLFKDKSEIHEANFVELV